MTNLINARFVLGISPENEQISALLGLPSASIDDPTLITADVVVVVASSKSGIDQKIVSQWHTFRELYIPTIVAVIDFEEGDVDFEDMNAIVGKMLEPVVTPYLVLHADNDSSTDHGAKHRAQTTDQGHQHHFARHGPVHICQ